MLVHNRLDGIFKRCCIGIRCTCFTDKHLCFIHLVSDRRGHCSEIFDIKTLAQPISDKGTDAIYHLTPVQGHGMMNHYCVPLFLTFNYIECDFGKCIRGVLSFSCWLLPPCLQP